MTKWPQIAACALLITYIAVSCTFATYLYISHDGAVISTERLFAIFFAWYALWQLVVVIVGPPWTHDRM